MYKLKRWTKPDYWSASSDSWVFSNKCFVFIGRNRDSSLLERVNFDCALKALGGESKTVEVVRERHWAYGWIKWIAIHESDSTALETAQDILDALSDYPVINELEYCQAEHDAINEYWESLSIRDRAELCRDNGTSIYAARRDQYPESLFETLSQIVT